MITTDATAKANSVEADGIRLSVEQGPRAAHRQFRCRVVAAPVEPAHHRRREHAVQHHRQRDREADGRPQPALLGEGRGPGGVGDVVDRADPAHPEERDDQPLAVVEARARPDLGAVPEERRATPPPAG